MHHATLLAYANQTHTRTAPCGSLLHRNKLLPYADTLRYPQPPLRTGSQRKRRNDPGANLLNSDPWRPTASLPVTRDKLLTRDSIDDRQAIGRLFSFQDIGPPSHLDSLDHDLNMPPWFI